MTSLTDVYEGRVGRVASRRQQLLGSALFLAGATMLVGAIAVATTAVGYRTLGELPARELGGTLAGVGLPAVLLGVFALLPASRRVRAAAVIGTGLSLLGVGLFRHAYPYRWVEGAPLLALATTTVYFAGVATTFWCLFVGLATFKTRNDPGGTARMEVTREGTIRLVEEARSGEGLGGIGFFGSDPDGSVATQTNRDGDRATRPRPGGAVSDGGSRTADVASPNGTVASPNGTVASPTGPDRPTGSDRDEDAPDQRWHPDEYCGNCRHFEYDSRDGEPAPYCKYHDRHMDDMDACSAWTNQSP